MGPLRIAILATAIPPTLFAVTSVILTLLNPNLLKTEGLNIVDNLLQVSIGLLAIALISLVVFAIRRKRDITKGIVVGFCIGFIAWAISFIVVSVVYEGL